jgi:Flp pilus assembly protein TadB
MASTSTSKNTPSRSRTNKPISKRAPRHKIAESQGDDTQQGSIKQTGSRLPSGQPEQLMILVAAIVFGLVGLVIHPFVIASIVLMALLLGLIASEARRNRGRGIVSEVVNEAKVVIEEIKKPGKVDTGELSAPSTTTSKPPE